jgi:hypothetical protein
MKFPVEAATERLVSEQETWLTARNAAARLGYRLARLVVDAGAILRRGAVASVDPASREIRTVEGETLRRAAARRGGVEGRPYPRALAFGRSGIVDRMHGLIQDVEGGYVTRIAFVVAPGVSWPPAALRAGAHDGRPCPRDVRPRRADTSEALALDIFAANASGDVAALLLGPCGDRRASARHTPVSSSSTPTDGCPARPMSTPPVTRRSSRSSREGSRVSGPARGRGDRREGRRGDRAQAVHAVPPPEGSLWTTIAGRELSRHLPGMPALSSRETVGTRLRGGLRQVND